MIAKQKTKQMIKWKTKQKTWIQEQNKYNLINKYNRESNKTNKTYRINRIRICNRH